MASFNLTAQINVQGPANLKTVVADIRRELSSIKTDLNISISSKAASNIKGVTTSVQALSMALIEANTNALKLSGTLSSMSSASSKLGASTNQAAQSISKIKTESAATAQAVGVASSEMAEFGKQSALAVRRFAAFSVVTGIIYGFSRALSSAFGEFVNFDKEMVRLQQVTGGSAASVKSLGDEVTRLATTFGVSSAELITVSSTLAQAGLSADETRIALEALAKSSLAPSFDSMAETAEGAIAAMRQFGIATEDLEGALGSINSVAAAFAVESADIITAIQRTGGVFASASQGVSSGTDALNEFMAVFTSVRATTRESAETIATGLRTIFTRIQRGSTIEALREFGIELTDLEGKFVGPYEATRRLSEGLATLDTRDIRFGNIVEQLGGFRQIGKVIPLIQQFAVAQEALSVAQRGAGSLGNDAAKAQSALAVQFTKTREEFLGLVRALGESKTFQNIISMGLTLTSTLIGVVGAFKPLLPYLAILGAIKGGKALMEFGSGFMGGLGKKPAGGSGGGETKEVSAAAKEKETADTSSRLQVALGENTSALLNVTTALKSLEAAVLSSRSGGKGLSGGGRVRAFARGGFVPGSGSGDTVPAMLEPGEFVIRKKAVDTLGASNLHKMNKSSGGNIRVGGYSGGGAVQKFALGGKANIARIKEGTAVAKDGDTFSATAVPTGEQFKATFRVDNYDTYESDKPSRVSQSKARQIQEVNKRQEQYPKTDTGYLIPANTKILPGRTAADMAAAAETELTSKLSKFNETQIVPGGDGGFGRYLVRGFDVNENYKTGRTWKNGTVKFAAGGKIQKFMAGGIVERKVGYIDSDVLRDPVNQGVVGPAMKGLKITDVNAYKTYLSKLAASSRKEGSLSKLRTIAGMPGAGKSSLMLGGSQSAASDNAKLRRTTRFPILKPEDIKLASEVIDTTATVTPDKLDDYLKAADKIYMLSTSTREEQTELKRRRGSRDTTGVNLFGRKPGSTSGAETDSGPLEAMLGSDIDASKLRTLGISSDYKLKRKENIEVQKKKIALLHGSLSPSTIGHESLRTAAEAMGVPLEDFLVLISNNEAITSADEHSLRTAVFDQDFRVLAAQAAFKGSMVSKQTNRGFVLPDVMEISQGPSGKRRFIRPEEGSSGMMVAGEGKNIKKYLDKSYKPVQIPRTGGVSGTVARKSILSGNLEEMKKILSPDVFSLVSQYLPQLQNRSSILPRIVEHSKKRQAYSLADITRELAGLPQRIDRKKAASDPEYAAMAAQVEELRNRRDKINTRAGFEPFGILRNLAARYPETYGLQPDATLSQAVKESVIAQGIVAAKSRPKNPGGAENPQFMAGGKPKSALPATAAQISSMLQGSKMPEDLKYGEFNGVPITDGMVRKTWRAGYDDQMGGEKAASYGAVRDYFLEKFNSNKEIQAARLAKRTAAATQVGLVGLLPYDHDEDLGPFDIQGRDVVIHERGLPTRFKPMVEKMQASSTDTVRQLATDLQSEITTGGLSSGQQMVYDFDQTLVTGADLYDSKGNIDIPGYSDLKRVGEALKNGELTPLGIDLKDKLTKYPELLKNLRISTARPPNNEALIAQRLAELGLNITADKITGMNGADKSKNLKPDETLVDDNIQTIERVRKAGMKGVQYSPSLSELSQNTSMATGQANIEGAVIEQAMAVFGAPIVEDATATRAIDYPNGLGGRATSFFPGISSSMPAEVKRTIDSKSRAKAIGEFTRYLFPEPVPVGKNLGGMIQKFAKGGAASDTVPAMLTPGEFVINKKAAQSIGYTKLARMNHADKVQGFARGGAVGGIKGFAGGGAVGGIQYFLTGGEAEALMADAAKKAGVSLEKFRAQIAASIAAEAKKIQEGQTVAKANFKLDAIKTKESFERGGLKGAKRDASGEFVDKDMRATFDKEVSSITEKLLAINPTLSFDQAQQQATDLAEALIRVDDSTENVIAMNADVVKSLQTNINAIQAEGQARKTVGEKAGIGSVEQSVVSKTAVKKAASKQNVEDIFSGAKITDVLTKKFGNTGAMIGGGIEKLGGPLGVATKGLQALALVTNFATKGTTDPNTAGIAGGIQGAATGSMAGAEIGKMFGPWGALIGAGLGGVVGALKGFSDAANATILKNNLDALAETTMVVDKSLEELSKNSSDFNVNRTEDALRNNAVSLQSIDKQANIGASGAGRDTLEFFRAFDITGLTASLSGMEAETEARKALVAGLANELDGYEKLGKVKIKNVSTAEIEQTANISAQANKQLSTLDKEARTATPARKIDIDTEKKAIQDRKTEDLYRKSQTYKELTTTAGKTDDEALKQRAMKDVQAKGGDIGEFIKEIENPLSESYQRHMARARELYAADAATESAAERAARQIKDLAVEIDLFVGQMDNLSATIQRAGNEMKASFDTAKNKVGTKTGQSFVPTVDRSNENVLNNLKAYSPEEVKAAVSGVGTQAGFSKELTQKLSDSAIASKVLTQQLPEIMAKAAAEANTDPGDTEEKIEKALRQALGGLSNDQNKETIIRDTMGIVQENKNKGDGADKSYGALIKNAPAMAAIETQTGAALKVLQETAKALNDALEAMTTQAIAAADAFEKAQEYRNVAQNIRTEAANSLAKAQGKELSLDQQNKPFNDTIASLTNTPTIGGGPTEDPAVIARRLDKLDNALPKAQKEMRDAIAADAAAGKPAKGGAGEKATANFIGLKKESDNLAKALNKLATDSSRAGNALNRIQEIEQSNKAPQDKMLEIMSNISDPEYMNNIINANNSRNRILAGVGNVNDFKAGVEGQRMAESGMTTDEAKKSRQDFVGQAAPIMSTATRGAFTADQIERIFRYKGTEENDAMKAAVAEFIAGTKANAAANEKIADRFSDAGKLFEGSIGKAGLDFYTKIKESADVVAAQQAAAAQQQAAGAQQQAAGAQQQAAGVQQQAAQQQAAAVRPPVAPPIPAPLAPGQPPPQAPTLPPPQAAALPAPGQQQAPGGGTWIHVAGDIWALDGKLQQPPRAAPQTMKPLSPEMAAALGGSAVVPPKWEDIGTPEEQVIKKAAIEDSKAAGATTAAARETTTAAGALIIAANALTQAAPQAWGEAPKLAAGGPIYASKGSNISFQPRGTDTVPAMLTPGEFVVNREATQKNLPLLKSINGGAKGYEKGGAVYLAAGGAVSPAKDKKPDYDLVGVLDDSGIGSYAIAANILSDLKSFSGPKNEETRYLNKMANGGGSSSGSFFSANFAKVLSDVNRYVNRLVSQKRSTEDGSPAESDEMARRFMPYINQFNYRDKTNNKRLEGIDFTTMLSQAPEIFAAIDSHLGLEAFGDTQYGFKDPNKKIKAQGDATSIITNLTPDIDNILDIISTGDYNKQRLQDRSFSNLQVPITNTVRGWVLAQPGARGSRRGGPNEVFDTVIPGMGNQKYFDNEIRIDQIVSDLYSNTKTKDVNEFMEWIKTPGVATTMAEDFAKINKWQKAPGTSIRANLVEQMSLIAQANLSQAQRDIFGTTEQRDADMTKEALDNSMGVNSQRQKILRSLVGIRKQGILENPGVESILDDIGLLPEQGRSKGDVYKESRGASITNLVKRGLGYKTNQGSGFTDAQKAEQQRKKDSLKPSGRTQANATGMSGKYTLYAEQELLQDQMDIRKEFLDVALQHRNGYMSDQEYKTNLPLFQNRQKALAKRLPQSSPISIPMNEASVYLGQNLPFEAGFVSILEMEKAIKLLETPEASVYDSAREIADAAIAPGGGLNTKRKPPKKAQTYEDIYNASALADMSDFQNAMSNLGRSELEIGRKSNDLDRIFNLPRTPTKVIPAVADPFANIPKDEKGIPYQKTDIVSGLTPDAAKTHDVSSKIPNDYVLGIYSQLKQDDQPFSDDEGKPLRFQSVEEVINDALDFHNFHYDDRSIADGQILKESRDLQSYIRRATRSDWQKKNPTEGDENRPVNMNTIPAAIKLIADLKERSARNRPKKLSALETSQDQTLAQNRAISAQNEKNKQDRKAAGNKPKGSERITNAFLSNEDMGILNDLIEPFLEGSLFPASVVAGRLNAGLLKNGQELNPKIPSAFTSFFPMDPITPELADTQIQPFIDSLRHGMGMGKTNIVNSRIPKISRGLIDTNSGITGYQGLNIIDNIIPDMFGYLEATKQRLQNPKMVAEQFNSGGVVYASKGSHINFQPRGTDTVPAMLTPGEFVVNRAATQKNLPLLKSINSGAKGYERGGVGYLADGGSVKRKPKTFNDLSQDQKQEYAELTMMSLPEAETHYNKNQKILFGSQSYGNEPGPSIGADTRTQQQRTASEQQYSFDNDLQDVPTWWGTRKERDFEKELRKANSLHPDMTPGLDADFYPNYYALQSMMNDIFQGLATRPGPTTLVNQRTPRRPTLPRTTGLPPRKRSGLTGYGTNIPNVQAFSGSGAAFDKVDMSKSPGGMLGAAFYVGFGSEPEGLAYNHARMAIYKHLRKGGSMKDFGGGIYPVGIKGGISDFPEANDPLTKIHQEAMQKIFAEAGVATSFQYQQGGKSITSKLNSNTTFTEALNILTQNLATKIEPQINKNNEPDPRQEALRTASQQARELMVRHGIAGSKDMAGNMLGQAMAAIYDPDRIILGKPVVPTDMDTESMPKVSKPIGPPPPPPLPPPKRPAPPPIPPMPPLPKRPAAPPIVKPQVKPPMPSKGKPSTRPTAREQLILKNIGETTNLDEMVDAVRIERRVPQDILDKFINQDSPYAKSLQQVVEQEGGSVAENRGRWFFPLNETEASHQAYFYAKTRDQMTRDQTEKANPLDVNDAKSMDPSNLIFKIIQIKRRDLEQYRLLNEKMQKNPLTARSKQQGSELLLPRELAATARTVGVEDLPVNVQMALQFPEYSEYFKAVAPVLSPRILEQLGDPYALPISQRYITGTKNPFGPGTPDTMSQDIIEKIVADYKYKLEYDKSIDPKKTIDKIKKASKFHSAPELVEKYGLKLLEERLDTGIELAGPQQFNSGGIVYASKGSHINFQPRGTDTVPAMLTPGEFVVNREATKKNLPLLKSINSGAKGYERGGAVYLAGGGDPAETASDMTAYTYRKALVEAMREVTLNSNDQAPRPVAPDRNSFGPGDSGDREFESAKMSYIKILGEWNVDNILRARGRAYVDKAISNKEKQKRIDADALNTKARKKYEWQGIDIKRYERGGVVYLAGGGFGGMSNAKRKVVTLRQPVRPRPNPPITPRPNPPITPRPNPPITPRPNPPITPRPNPPITPRPNPPITPRPNPPITPRPIGGGSNYTTGDRTFGYSGPGGGYSPPPLTKEQSDAREALTKKQSDARQARPGGGAGGTSSYTTGDRTFGYSGPGQGYNDLFTGNRGSTYSGPGQGYNDLFTGNRGSTYSGPGQAYNPRPLTKEQSDAREALANGGFTRAQQADLERARIAAGPLKIGQKDYRGGTYHGGAGGSSNAGYWTGGTRGHGGQWVDKPGPGISRYQWSQHMKTVYGERYKDSDESMTDTRGGGAGGTGSYTTGDRTFGYSGPGLGFVAPAGMDPSKMTRDELRKYSGLRPANTEEYSGSGGQRGMENSPAAIAARGTTLGAGNQYMVKAYGPDGNFLRWHDSRIPEIGANGSVTRHVRPWSPHGFSDDLSLFKSDRERIMGNVPAGGRGTLAKTQIPNQKASPPNPPITPRPIGGGSNYTTGDPTFGYSGPGLGSVPYRGSWPPPASWYDKYRKPKGWENGGLIYASKGSHINFQPRGTDTVPAMLTPGEFVVNRASTAKNLPLLRAINNRGSSTSYLSNGGAVQYLYDGGQPTGGVLNSGLTLNVGDLSASTNTFVGGVGSFGDSVSNFNSGVTSIASALGSLGNINSGLDSVTQGLTAAATSLQTSIGSLSSSLSTMFQALSDIPRSIDFKVSGSIPVNITVEVNGGNGLGTHLQPFAEQIFSAIETGLATSLVQSDIKFDRTIVTG